MPPSAWSSFVSPERDRLIRLSVNEAIVDLAVRNVSAVEIKRGTSGYFVKIFFSTEFFNSTFSFFFVFVGRIERNYWWHWSNNNLKEEENFRHRIENSIYFFAGWQIYVGEICVGRASWEQENRAIRETLSRWLPRYLRIDGKCRYLWKIYITLCIVGDRSTGTSDFIEAADSADTDTNVSVCVETCVYSFFLFFSPASFERNSFAPIRKNSITDQESPGSLRATDKKHR